MPLPAQQFTPNRVYEFEWQGTSWVFRRARMDRKHPDSVLKVQGILQSVEEKITVDVLLAQASR